MKVLLADLNLRIGSLKHQLQTLEERKQALEVVRDYKQLVFQEIRDNLDMRPLSQDETEGKSQRNILKVIARRNHNWLVVQAAIKLMVGAGILQQDTASAQVYTVLGQNKHEFTPVQPGIYRLAEDLDGTEVAKSPEAITKGRGQRMTLEKLAEIIQQNFSPPFLPEGLVRVVLQDDGTLKLFIGPRDIHINDAGVVLGAGTIVAKRKQ